MRASKRPRLGSPVEITYHLPIWIQISLALGVILLATSVTLLLIVATETSQRNREARHRTGQISQLQHEMEQIERDLRLHGHPAPP